MPIVQAKCENCSALLQVDSELRSAVCPSCGATYIVQDAISKYDVHADTITAKVVNLVDGDSASSRLEVADAYLKMGDYDKAEEVYEEICGKTPQEYRSWFGVVVARTHGFTKKIENVSELEALKDKIRRGRVLVPEGSGTSDTPAQFEEYLTRQEKRAEDERRARTEEFKALDKEIDAAQAEMEDLDNRIYPLRRQRIELLDKINELDKQLKKAKETGNFSFIVFCILLLLSPTILKNPLLIIPWPAIIWIICAIFKIRGILWNIGWIGTAVFVITAILYKIVDCIEDKKIKKSTKEIHAKKQPIEEKSKDLEEQIDSLNAKKQQIADTIDGYTCRQQKLNEEQMDYDGTTIGEIRSR